jgi:hypothetical protein
MKQRLVDPFIPAPGQLARSRAVEAARQQMPASKLENRRGSIDGVVHAGPVSSKATQSLPQQYHGPAASLHLRYASGVQAATAPQTQLMPTRSRALIPRPMAGDIRRSQKARPSPAAISTPTPQPSREPNPHVKTKVKTKKEGVSTLWLVIGAAIAGLAMFSVLAGQVAIAVYAIVALWRRWPSQQNFALALVMFGGIILASLVPTFQTVANNLAVYAFLLLCIGALSLAREVRRDARQTAPEQR